MWPARTEIGTEPAHHRPHMCDCDGAHIMHTKLSQPQNCHKPRRKRSKRTQSVQVIQPSPVAQQGCARGPGLNLPVGSEDKNDIMLVGQRIKWKTHDKYGPYISVDQKLTVDAVEEVKIDKSLKDNVQCNRQLHTAYRSVLGQLNWLQSRTQVHICYKFSRCASAAANPNIGDVREINKVVRTLKSQYVDGRFWPLKGSILGMPDASYRNNSDKSSQRAHVIFLAEDRKLPSKGTYRNSGYDKQAYRLNGSESATRGSIIDYESHKITTTTQSTTVAELNALMTCFGTCLFLRALWADISGETVPIHIKTDANNLVTTAQTTHLPEQKENHHLIQMLRHESNTGHLDDKSHCK